MASFGWYIHIGGSSSLFNHEILDTKWYDNNSNYDEDNNTCT